MEEILRKGKLGEVADVVGIPKDTPFSKLERLHLESLPELKSIYWGTLPFPCLKRISIVDCPKLKKLPLDSDSTKGNHISIEGNPHWWAGLGWENETTRQVFLSSFRIRSGFSRTESSEARCSARSDDGEYPLDMDSLDHFEEGESDKVKDDTANWKSFIYVTLAHANYAGGSAFFKHVVQTHHLPSDQAEREAESSSSSSSGSSNQRRKSKSQSFQGGDISLIEHGMKSALENKEETLEKNLNSKNSSKVENWCNENNDFPNTHVGVSKSVSPISIRPSWVNVVEKSLRVDHIEQTGEIVGAGLDPIEERVTKDISAMGFERHNTYLEEGGSEVEAGELLGSDADRKKKEKKYGSLLAIQDKVLSKADRKKRDRAKKRIKTKGKDLERMELEGNSITDSDMQVRRNALLEEAKKTLAIGKVVGIEIIGDEAQALEELEKSERLGQKNRSYGIKEFNEFIDTCNLVEVPLVGRKVTWTGAGKKKKRSKIDRFLVDINWLQGKTYAVVNSLLRNISDHVSILLSTENTNLGSRPFKLSNHLSVINICTFLDQELEEDDEGAEVPVSIYSVPKVLISSNPDCYTPQQVALGPYHQWGPELYETERHKVAAARRIRRRSRLSFPSLVQHLQKLEPRIRACYNKYLDLDGETLAWMMAVNGSFLLEFLQIHEKTSPTMSRLVGTKSAHELILRDILLEIQYSSSEAADEIELSMLKGLSEELSPFKTMEINSNKIDISNCPHVLDFLHLMIVPKLEEVVESDEIRCPDRYISPPDHFHRQQHRGCPKELGGIRSIVCVRTAGFTRYTELMNGIINTEEDVRLLRDKGIVRNSLKSDKEAVGLWNGMSKSIRLTKVRLLDKLIEDVNKYYNSRWKVKLKNVLKHYVYGSWRFLTLLATKCFCS
ncbi:hypothetical protein GQ457_05G035620 [Hibiscus cannabinus]